MSTQTHNEHRDASGRYSKWPTCDGCGKPVNVAERSYTDSEVCGATDGPGFRLCGRVRCEKRTQGTVGQRRALYERQRAENERALAAGEKPRAV